MSKGDKMTKQEKTRRAFDEGYAARRVKLHRQGCPYRRQWLRTSWLAGVYAASADL